MAQAYVPPQVEDYHSDDSSDGGQALEPLRRSPGQANVAAKRSHPSDLGSDKAPAQENKAMNNVDLQSDSGYSSHTAATIGSADSAPSAVPLQSPPAPAASAPPVAPASPAPAPPPPAPRRRPAVSSGDRKHSSQSSQNSPRKPLQRTASTSQRPPKERRSTATKDCTEPNCTKCTPYAQHTQPYDQLSQRSAPASTYAPPSPTYGRRAAPYMHGSATIQPAQSRQRSSSTAPRPMSYHGDPGQAYWPQSNAYPSPQEHGPPPSMSAPFYPPNMQHQAPMASWSHHPAFHNYPGAFPLQQTSPPYDHSRPPLSARNTSYQARGVPGHPTPLITQEQQNLPSARYGSYPQQSFQNDEETEDSESDYSDQEQLFYDQRSQRALMPPPDVKPAKPRRPSIRHANTTPGHGERRMSQSQTLPERPKERDPRTSRVSTATSSRNQSVSRPALIQKPKAQSYETTGRGKVTVENSQRRRRSNQTYDNTYDYRYEPDQIRRPLPKKYYSEYVPEAKPRNRRSTTYDNAHEVNPRREHRSSRLYNDEIDYEFEPKRRNRASQSYNQEYEVEQKRSNRNSRSYRDADEAAVVVENTRRNRRGTDVEPRRGERVSETKNKRTEMDALAYQHRTRGRQEPFNDTIHKAAKRASRVPSDSGSSRSKGSDGVSQSAQTNTTNGNEIRLRVDASKTLELKFNGEESRTIQFNPTDDGMADIVIGNTAYDEESIQPSGGGSKRSNSTLASRRQSIVANRARREAEVDEYSNQSSRSGYRESKQKRPSAGRRHSTVYYEG